MVRPRSQHTTGLSLYAIVMQPTGGMASTNRPFEAPTFAMGKPVPRRPAQTTWRSGADVVAEGIVQRRITDGTTMQFWQRSNSHADVLRFVNELCAVIAGRRLTEAVPHSRMIDVVCDVLHEASTWSDDYPPERHAMRYGNPAFKKWHAKMCERMPELMRKFLESAATLTPTPVNQTAGSGAVPAVLSTAATAAPSRLPGSFLESALTTRVEYEASLRLPVEQRLALESAARELHTRAVLGTPMPVEPAAPPAAPPAENAAACAEDLERRARELGSYLAESFGNATRIDYGTGHELAFLVIAP